MQIDGRSIGVAHRPYIIAEVSNNHLADPERACRLVEVAAKAGADAVKIQTYDADSLTIDSDRPEFLITTPPWKGLNYYQLYKQIALPAKFTRRLFQVAKDCGITMFSSPFDDRAVELLEGLNCPAYKIASFEICDDPLLRSVAATGKPVFVSTGIANLSDIEVTLDLLQTHGSKDIGLFHCVSEYPAKTSDMNLMSLDRLAQFGVPVGLSDHTLTHTAAMLAVARGAAFIEKHFTLARSDGGPDSSFSLEPQELSEFVQAVNQAWDAMGSCQVLQQRRRPGSEHSRSLFIVEKIAAGETISVQHVRAIRPGVGLPPRSLGQVIGKKARRNLERGEPLKWEDLA